MRGLSRGAIIGVGVLAVVSCVSGNNYYRYLVALVGLTTMVGVGLNILLGLSGQVSLGQVGFYAIGAYTAALLTTKGGVSFWPALVGAGSLAAVCAATGPHAAGRNRNQGSM